MSKPLTVVGVHMPGDSLRYTADWFEQYGRGQLRGRAVRVGPNEFDIVSVFIEGGTELSSEAVAIAAVERVREEFERRQQEVPEGLGCDGIIPTGRYTLEHAGVIYNDTEAATL